MSPTMGLVVWFNQSAEFSRYELCYDKDCEEMSLTHRAGGGIVHTGIDSGEPTGFGYKASPIHTAARPLNTQHRIESFMAQAAEVPGDIQRIVLDSISTAAQG